ncbi:hypothetical protein Tco_0693135 [Tanacetum coccineum]
MQGLQGVQGMSYREQLNTNVKGSMVKAASHILEHSPYSNKLQSLNASFSLGVVTPTTSTEAGSSVALGM